jgi:hypothetical protein
MLSMSPVATQVELAQTIAPPWEVRVLIKSAEEVVTPTGMFPTDSDVGDHCFS